VVQFGGSRGSQHSGTIARKSDGSGGAAAAAHWGIDCAAVNSIGCHSADHAESNCSASDSLRRSSRLSRLSHGIKTNNRLGFMGRGIWGFGDLGIWGFRDFELGRARPNP
jgi:hypothetical protein